MKSDECLVMSLESVSVGSEDYKFEMRKICWCGVRKK